MSKTTTSISAVNLEIARLHSEILTAARTSLDKAIRIGQLLTEQKAQLKHGEWLPWVKENLPFDARSSARRHFRLTGGRMAKSFLRRSKCDKSTLRRVEIIARRGYYKKRRRQTLPLEIVRTA